jgi:arylsulfatase A-like enzyme
MVKRRDFFKVGGAGLAGMVSRPLWAGGGHHSAHSPADPSTTEPGVKLPRPDAPFNGVIRPSAKDSTPEWPKPVTPPPGAPNVVVILLDDVGFSVTSTFGGPVHTPELDKCAGQGLRYNNFNTVGICSPTRASLLTGRNHHRVGFGIVTGQANGFPGYNNEWKKSVASVAQVLRGNGYSTAAFGKWHNTPDWEISPIGPFDHWPTALGFEHFYGFLAGATDEWEPPLYAGTAPVEPPKTAQQGYYFTNDIVDRSIAFIHTHESLAPEKPYFLYFATHATHAPHQAVLEWIAKYRGQFDQGWDKLREENFARQKKLGVIPADAELTPRPEQISAWKTLTDDQKRFFAHQMEVFAGYMAETDYEIGRLVKTIQDGPNGDNTVIFLIVGDNGASGDGGPTGYDDFGYALRETMRERMSHLNELGGVNSNDHYAYGWGWANATPFKGVKKMPCYFGATRDPMIVIWPKRIKEKGGLRTQFLHVTDVAPTIYDVVGIDFPSEVDGIRQEALDGTSFAYSFDRPDEPSRHRVQYFEIEGNRAIYKDGWIATGYHWAPWDSSKHFDLDYTHDRWELYNVARDFSESHDLAARYPEKLRELQDLFDVEARKNQVYPLGGGDLRAKPPSISDGRREFVFYPDLPRIPVPAAPDFTKSHRIDAYITITDSEARGTIVSCGSRFGGFAFYVEDGYLFYDNNYADRAHNVITSGTKLPHGDVKVSYEFVSHSTPASYIDSIVKGASGDGRLFVNGQLVGEGKISHFARLPPFYGGFGVGRNYVSPISQAYELPFAFTGTINKVTVTIE